MSAPGRHAAGVLLVNRAGHILLQLRDGNTAISPHQWALVAGGVEADESALEAAERELFEETGLSKTTDWELLFEGVRPAFDGGQVLWTVFVGATPARSSDIVVGEGRTIMFVDPRDVPSLDLGMSGAFFVPLFLESPQYSALLRDSNEC